MKYLVLAFFSLVLATACNAASGVEDDTDPTFWDRHCIVIAKVIDGIDYGKKTLHLQVMAVIATDFTVPIDITTEYVAGGDSGLDGSQLLRGNIIATALERDGEKWFIPRDGIPCIGHKNGSAAIAVSGISDDTVKIIEKRVHEAREKAHSKPRPEPSYRK